MGREGCAKVRPTALSGSVVSGQVRSWMLSGGRGRFQLQYIFFNGFFFVLIAKVKSGYRFRGVKCAEMIQIFV